MYLVLDIWHFVPTFNEVLDGLKIGVLARFKAIAIMKDKLLVVASYYFFINVRYACHGLRLILLATLKIQDCGDIMDKLTAFLIPKAALITEDFPTPVYEWLRYQVVHHK